MKKFLIAFAILIGSTPSYSQVLNGGYMLHEKNLKEGYYFWDNGEFIWFRFTENEKEYGEGKYVYNGDVVTLNFAKARRKFDLKDSESFPLPGKKAVVDVNAITSANIPVKGVRLILKRSDVVLTTDSSGYSIVEIADAVPSDEVRFELAGYEGYGTIDTSVTLRGRRNRFVIVVDDKIRYKEDQELSLKLIRGKKWITINRDEKSGTYNSVSKNKYLDFYHRIKT
jgi:hypothetical protein